MWILGQTVVTTIPEKPLSWTEQVSRYAQMGMDAVITFAPKVLIALVIGFVGWKVMKLVSRWLHRALEAKAVDPSLRPFLGSLLDVLLKVVLVITLITYLGIPTASFVAVLGAAGLAIGLALSGTLQNFAGGVVLLAIRPFRVGDQIKAQSFEGKVHAIGIFQTMLVTPDNLTVFIPNGELMNESIMNYSLQGTRRADLIFGIGYGDSIDQAREVILRLIGEEPRILAEPAPIVIVKNLGESSVDLEARFWVQVTDHFGVSNAIREAVKKAFDAEGISFPFPQREVLLIRPDKEQPA
jgi:small conductance mechanosensitive channel